MPDPVIIQLTSQPGIKRDGTVFDGKNYTDAQWCRWQRGKPRKIGGYSNILSGLTGISRGAWGYNSTGNTYVYSGWSGGLDMVTVDRNGNPGLIADRTPVGFPTDPNAMPTFDTIYDAGLGSGTVTISSITHLTTVATVTTSAPHGLYTGQQVTISGASPAAYNGTFIITVTGDTTFTYVMASDPGSNATGTLLYNIVSSSVIMHVAPNLQFIDSDIEGAAFIGAATSMAPMVQIPGVTVSGGCVALYPYAFYYGSGGQVQWSVPNQPTDVTGTGSGTGRITGQKIVKGLSLRGSSQGPAGLFWSLNAIVRASFQGGDSPWHFDELTTQSSILASNSVIEYDGRYFWLGVDRFLMFNGVIQDLPNDMNINYFFDNVNYSAAQKIFAFKVPRFGEIWWCYPRGNATECTHAIILNVRESSWYDTQLPGGGRSAALYAQVFRRPMMMGVDLDPVTNGYRLWQHETGVDEINGSMLNPIPSWFQTSDFTLNANPDGSAGIVDTMDLSIVEPDFVQVGDMQMQVATRANAKSATVLTDPVTIFQTPPQQSDTVAYVRVSSSSRQASFKFTSNTVGGDYQLGQSLFHMEKGEKRYL